MTVYFTRWLRRFLLCSLTTLLLTIGSGAVPLSTMGQLPALPVTGSPAPLPAGVVRRGTLESAPVRLDGRELFRIASPTVLNRNEPGAQIPIEVRAKEVEANLGQVIETALEESNLKAETLNVLTKFTGNLPVLYAQIPTHAELSVLLTVTNSDAQFHSTSLSNLASRWEQILAKELRQALILRQPEAFQQQVITAVKVLGLASLLTMLLGSTWTLIGRRYQRLKQKQTVEQRSLRPMPAANQPDPQQFSEPGTDALEPSTMHHHFGLERRLQTLQLIRWILFWAIALIWLGSIAYSLNEFPQTRHISKRLITIPTVLLVTWFLTGTVNRVTDMLSDRYVQSREQEDSLTPASLQRVTTIAKVIKGLKMVILYTVTILWALQSLNLAASAVLTIGAVLALAVSFAAQNLVKDVVNGFLILVEDQFRIGDMVTIGTHSGMNPINGLVENLNLRLTQLRNPSGNLITIPNSTIAQVENMSRNWARADFQIEVAYQTDVDRALALVRETLDQMACEPDWQPLILDTREVFGIEQLTHTGITIRVWIKTLPLKQWDVAREFRRRLKIAFDRNHIQIGTPQQIWQGNSTSEISQPAASAQQPLKHD